MSRRLTGDERALWDRLRRSVRPLSRRRPEPDAEERSEPVPPAKADAKAKPKRPARASAIVVKQQSKPPPPLAPIETKTRRRLARGHVAIDARIDLHGMVQTRAFAALSAFLHEQQQRGARTLLVVTGKGKAGEEGRGVLRRNVPEWLARAELRPLVLGFEESDRRHGGAGALYVRLRRRTGTR